MDSGRGLAGNQRTRAASRQDLDEMAVAVQESGGKIDKIKEGCGLSFEHEGGHQSNRNLLVAASQ